MARTWKQQRAEIQAKAEADGKVTTIPAPQATLNFIANSRPANLTNEERLIRINRARARRDASAAARMAREPKTEAEIAQRRKRVIDAERRARGRG